MTEPLRAWSGVLLAGGPSRRLGGADKALLMVGGVSLLERAVTSLVDSGASSVVIVGPLRQSSSFPAGVLLAQESPAGAGPAAATLAGARALEVSDDQLLLVAAADLPLMDRVLPDLIDAATIAVANGRDGAMVTAAGRDHYLLQCVRRDALLRAAGSDDLTNGSMRDLVSRLDLERIEVDHEAVIDADTWQAVSQLRRQLNPEASMERTSDWVKQVSATAGLESPPLDVDAVLALARDAAHGVERPAAPITTFLLGFAAGALHLDAAGVAELAERLGRDALEFDGTPGT